MGLRGEAGSSWRGLVPRDRELGLKLVTGDVPAFANAQGWDVELTAYAARDGRASGTPSCHGGLPFSGHYDSGTQPTACGGRR